MDCWPPEARAEAERLAEQGRSYRMRATGRGTTTSTERWRSACAVWGYLGVGEPYWHHFAQAGAAVSDAAVPFASTLRPEH